MFQHAADIEFRGTHQLTAEPKAWNNRGAGHNGYTSNGYRAIVFGAFNLVEKGHLS